MYKHMDFCWMYRTLCRQCTRRLWLNKNYILFAGMGRGCLGVKGPRLKRSHSTIYSLCPCSGWDGNDVLGWFCCLNVCQKSKCFRKMIYFDPEYCSFIMPKLIDCLVCHILPFYVQNKVFCSILWVILHAFS